MYGDDYQYASTRLDGTIVRLKGKPVYIHHVTDCHTVSYTDLSDKFGVRGVCGLADLDVRPIKLGWVNNLDRSAFYMARKPMRRDWRQGLRRENVVFYAEGMAGRDVDLLHVVNQFFTNKLTFKEALSRVREKSTSRIRFCQSWHREWAVDNKGNLLWKFGSIVGSIEKDVPVLGKGFKHLKESLEESL